jgi:hypothetical protein
VSPTVSSPSVIEGYSLILDRDHDLPWPVEDEDVVLPLLIRPERLLNDVAAKCFNRLIQMLGFITQPDSVGYLPHEIHHGR